MTSWPHTFTSTVRQEASIPMTDHFPTFAKPVAMVNISIVSSAMRQSLQLLLAPLLRLWADPERRRKFLRWVFGGTSGAIALLVILEASRASVALRWRLPSYWRASLDALQDHSAIHCGGFKPKFPKWTLRYELLHGLMRSAATMFGERIVDVQHARVIRHHTAMFGTFLGLFARWQHDLSRAIKQELASDDVDVDVFLANYRKIPECQFPVPARRCRGHVRVLTAARETEAIADYSGGDSAGGGLVMSTLLRVRDGLSSWKSKLPLPLAAIVMCPLADLTWDENGLLANTVSSASTWRLQCTFSGHSVQHSVRLEAKAIADGVVNWEVDIHEGVPHVFMVIPGYVLPYARVGVQRMAAFAAKQFVNGITRP
ncbi:Alpha/Beta hydrolase fold [Phytophthora cactorum]|nr:Alpha/Beta hydrolase fold [Phytophthora cactorum]